MDLFRNNKSFFYMVFFLCSILGSWLLLSQFDTGQAHNNLIDKETLRLQVKYSVEIK